MREKFKLGAGSFATLLLVVAVLLALNLISVYLFSRLDLTEGKVFSLSQSSKNVVRNLNDRLIVKMYFTKDLPPPYNGYARYLKDQLEEYQAYAGGKLKLELIDPNEEGKEMEAQRYGIPPLQVNAMENDKIEIKKVYMGLAFLFEDRKEVIPVIQNVSGLEYELTSAIKRLSTRFLPTIGFLAGQDELDLNSELSSLQQALTRQYQVRKIELEEGKTIPTDVSVLIVMGPKKKFSEWGKYAIDQFLMRGGKLALLLNQIEVDLQQGVAGKQDLGLDELLQSYGVKINDDLVIDLQCNRIGITQRQGTLVYQNVVNYPFFPVASSFDKNSLIVKDLGTVSFYFASSLNTSLALSENLHFEPIVWSSKNSGVLVAPFDVNPYKKFAKEDFNKNGLILAATLQGSFKSFFSDKERPYIESGVNPPESTLSSSPQTRLVVVGDADLVTDQNIKGTDNLVFFLNMVDWLSQDEALIAIRSKQVTSRPLKEISAGAKKLVKYGNTFGLPFLVIVFGVVRWQIRKRVRRKGSSLRFSRAETLEENKNA